MSAEIDFAAGQAEVRTLLSLCLDGEEHLERNNAVRRASVVLLVSHFESFLRSIAEDFVDLVGSGAIESRSIPSGIRELHTLPRLKEIMNSNDLNQRQVLLRKLGDQAMLWNDTAKPPKGALTASKLSREVTSAKAEKIDRLFELMGSPVAVCDGDLDIAEDDGEVESTNIRLALEDVVLCRNDIAHGDSARRPTSEDLERYMRFLAALASRLQRKATGLSAAFMP